jgi:hypothetical protein
MLYSQQPLLKSVAKATFLFAMLLALAIPHKAQNLIWNAKVGIGPSIVTVPGWENYATIKQPLRLSHNLAVGAALPLSQRLELGIELGMDGNSLAINFLSSRTPKHVESQLTLNWASISPGLTLHLGNRFAIRGSVNVLVAAFAHGDYTIWYVDHDLNQVVTETYDEDFGRIRKPLTLGPEIRVGVNVLQRDWGSLAVLAEGYMGLNSVFKSSFDTPVNPKMGRLCLGLGLSWGGAK